MKKFLAVILSMLLLCAAGCSQQPSADANVVLDMQNVYQQLQQAAEMPEMLTLDADMMLNYCGIKAEDTAQAVVVICADSLRADEIWLIEAVDEAAAKRIVDLANTRVQLKDEESAAYSPEQNAIVKKAELIQQGNYVALIVSPDVDAMAEAFRAAAGLK